MRDVGGVLVAPGTGGLRDGLVGGGEQEGVPGLGIGGEEVGRAIRREAPDGRFAERCGLRPDPPRIAQQRAGELCAEALAESLHEAVAR